MVVYIYFAFLATVSVLCCEIYFLMFLNVHVKNIFNIASGGSVFYSVFTLILVSTALGLLIGSTLKNSNPIAILGIAIIFVTFILSGVIVPAEYLAGVKVIAYINLFSPLNYPLTLTCIT